MRFRLKREVCDSIGWCFVELADRLDSERWTPRLYDVGTWFYTRT